MKTPLTVLMAVHNGGRFLRTAVESILNQTYRNFNFLIVDDASTDGSREMIRTIGDPRITLLCLEKNVGQTAALNVGLQHIESPWIARMDADDYSAPTRFEEQMRALESNPSLRCVGTFAWIFREDFSKSEEIIARPVDEQAIRHHLLKGIPMIHGTIVVSREAMNQIGGYNERYRYSQDLDLFSRLLTRFSGANIPKPLLGFRRHEGQGSFCVRAAEESVEIFSSMSLDPQYTPTEKLVLRESLAVSYFFRGTRYRVAGKYRNWWKDLGLAWRTSPKVTLRAVGTSMIPSRLVDSLKRVLSNNGVKS